jgi:NAD(P)-dependent dehydrogenase (short-subunit alcohol dehydrogenase family)
MTRTLIIGASGGIGAALAQECRARGENVTTLSRKADGFDITNADCVARYMAALNGPYHRVIIATGLLAPHGQTPEKALAQITPQNMAQVFAVNAIGPALVLAHLARLLPKDDRAVIGVLTARVGSIGDNQMGGWHSYRAAKAAANQIMRGAAIEIGRKFPQSVVLALHPGTVDTSFTANYPAHRKIPPDQAARRLIQVMDAQTPAETGQFFDWKGEKVIW